MIFLTVGTLFPFDRMVKTIDGIVKEGIIKDRVLAQIGRTNLIPKNIEYVEYLEKENFEKIIKEASYIISHAGVGSIIDAMKYNKPLLVMPRLKRYREHVNDHQLGIARKFSKNGHILAAYNERELKSQIRKLMSFNPKPRQTQSKEVVERVSRFLRQIEIA